LFSLIPEPLAVSALQALRNEFYKCPKNRLAQNVTTQKDPLEVAVSRPRFETTSHVYNVKVEEVKPICDQKSTGRCWNFAVHNAMRIPFMKQHNIEEFEFSQAYFFYWDKIERSYYFLNNIVESAKRGEEVSGRLVSFLLSDPIGDGGQWDMIVSIINKHGVMPKKCFPESFSSESSARMNAILKSKLREYAKQIRELFAANASDADVQAKVDGQMQEVYNIVGICLGIPPVTFTWEYYDKNKKYNRAGPVTALEFYEKLVKPYFNVSDKVCLVTDPRPSNEYGKGYTVDCLGNVVGGQAVFYNNQPVDVLIDLVAKSLKDGEPVWFGCDVGARFARYQGGVDDLEM
jgi:bleomycin hydrolase